MDRAKLSAVIIEELGDLFVQTLTEAAPDLVVADLDGIEQRLQRMGRVVMGRVVEHTVAAIAASQACEIPNCPKCKQPMRLVDPERKRELQGLVGDYRLLRPYYTCKACERQGLAPLDQHLGIGSGYLSPGLSRVACRLGIDDSFDESSDVLEETLQIHVVGEGTRRITEGIGAVAETGQQAAIALAQVGKEAVPAREVEPVGAAMVVEVDGAKVQFLDGWHEGKVGVIAKLGPKLAVDEKTGRVHQVPMEKTYFAGFESGDQFWWRVYVEAYRRGLGASELKLIVLLGDGSDWIWRYGRSFLAIGDAEIVEILDIMHVYEHLWKVGNTVFGVGSEEAARWVKPLENKLVEEGPAPILAAMQALVTADENAADEVRKAINYVTKHRDRMNYPSFVARRLPIGSGAVESTCKTLLEEREKGAGMRWTQAGAQQVATLRAVQRSGRWRDFWQTHPQRRRPLVFPRPRKSTA